jgi:hypothetical protein
MNKIVLLSFTALTMYTMADDVVVTQDPQMITDGCSKPSCNTPTPPPPEPCKPKPVECKPKPVECKPKPKPCVPCVRKGMAPNVLTSSRPCDDIGLYLFADALYWHADVTNAEWAFVNNAAGVTAPVSGINQELAFKWNWGFRVGLGYEFDHDQWDTNLSYTWFVNHASSGSTSSTNFTVPAGGAASSLNTDSSIAVADVLAGVANTKLNFNVLDWELGRAFYVSNSISFRPHFGIKSAWIKLSEREAFTGRAGTPVGTYSSKDKTKSWAVGPSAGINSNWYFGCANTMGDNHRGEKRGEVRDRPMFSVFGDISGAMMYGHFRNSHNETGTTAGALVDGLRMSGLNRNLMVPVLTGILGLAWDMCFDCDKMHLGIRAGYELQYWFRQNQRFSNFTPTGSTAPTYTRTTGDLALQGLTIDVRFDF